MAVGRRVAIKQRVATTANCRANGLPFHKTNVGVRPRVRERHRNQGTFPEFLAFNVLPESTSDITALAYIALRDVLILGSEQKVQANLLCFGHLQKSRY